MSHPSTECNSSCVSIRPQFWIELARVWNNPAYRKETKYTVGIRVGGQLLGQHEFRLHSEALAYVKSLQDSINPVEVLHFDRTK